MLNHSAVVLVRTVVSLVRVSVAYACQTQPVARRRSSIPANHGLRDDVCKGEFRIPNGYSIALVPLFGTVGWIHTVHCPSRESYPHGTSHGME